MNSAPRAQHFTTPAGEELVILPRAEYDALVAGLGEDEEDAADVAAFDAAMADLASGADAPLPVEVSAMILKGLSRTAAWRKHRGWSQQTLAEAAGIGQGYLSEIERGRPAPPETLERLAAALKVRPDQIG
ncbi:MAG: helix-turn-helix domain-containing protein [Proteobacteria bacterium]|nr:helix-turn-helix domain-containing protein [Pseudomonadota bacterium]